jgi:hypothetical protein
MSSRKTKQFEMYILCQAGKRKNEMNLNIKLSIDIGAIIALLIVVTLYLTGYIDIKLILIFILAKISFVVHLK